MHRLFLSCVLLCYATLASATCGTDWAPFIKDIEREAVAKGYARPWVQRFLDGTAQEPSVIKADRRQGVFPKRLHQLLKSIDLRPSLGARPEKRNQIRHNL